MARGRPGIVHRVLSVFRPRHRQVHESKEDFDISSPPFAPPPYIADKKQHPSPPPATNAQNATPPHPPRPSVHSQLKIGQYEYLSNARETRTKLIHSFKTITSSSNYQTIATRSLSIGTRKDCIDNMRRFIRHWLEREYLPDASAQASKATYSSHPHYTHMLNLARLLFYLVPFQNLHGWSPADVPLRNEVWDYVRATLRAPLQALGVDEPHVVQVLQYFYQHEGLYLPRQAARHVHEQFARDGWFEVLRANVAADLQMLEKVVGEEERNESGLLARETLENGIMNTRVLYFASVEKGSEAFRPSFLLTDYARKNLCPSCQGSVGI